MAVKFWKQNQTQKKPNQWNNKNAKFLIIWFCSMAFFIFSFQTLIFVFPSKEKFMNMLISKFAILFLALINSTINKSWETFSFVAWRTAEFCPSTCILLKSAEIELHHTQGPVPFWLNQEIPTQHGREFTASSLNLWGLPAICMAQQYFPLTA